MAGFMSTSSIYAVGFSVRGSEENKRLSNANVTNSGLFKLVEPVEGGVYGPHMGTTSLEWNCQTCMNRKTRCPGHFGSIDLVYPLKSPMFRERLLKWLKAVCLECGSPMTKKTVTAPRAKLLSNYVKLAKGVARCPECDAPHPVVLKNRTEQSNFYIEIREPGKETVMRTLYNHEIQQTLNKITDETVISMGKPLMSHPRKFMLSTIAVPPNTIRPDIRRFSGGRTNNHTTTAMLKTIMEIRAALPGSIPPPDQIDDDLHTMLQNLDSFYHDMVKGSTATHNQMRVATVSNRAPSSIASNIPQKRGRVRRNLLGKKVVFVVRSVITGDPSLRIDEIGFPKHIARTLSIPEVVRPYNKHILEVYYRNGRDVYPGCEGIRKNTGKDYDIRYLGDDYELQYGDIVYRDMIDGDVVIFNRAPSLTWTSTAGQKVVVLDKTDTLRCNVSVCSLYNGDFDGDAMMAIIPRNAQSRNEVAIMSKVGNWFISYKNSSPKIGAAQDTLVGAAEFTMEGISMNKWHAMSLMSQVDLPLKFNKKTYTNREMVSMLLPKINLIGKRPKMYMEQFAAFINYDPNDIEVNIDRGELKSGILDKATLGETSMGSVFHIINNEYGSHEALETVFRVQQMITMFLYYRGFTTGISDLVISEEAAQRIKQKIADMVLESRRITERLNRKDLIPPIGTSQEDFFELEQMNALEPGDDFVAPILGSIDFKTNNLAKLVFSGSKGSVNNLIAIHAALGNQKIDGVRPKRNFAYGRTSPYFTRYDTSPDSLGYVAASYKSGIPSYVYAFSAGTARQGVITIALTTSITGHQNRVAVKNMESILINNLRQAAKAQSVVQTLCLESGIDPRRTEKVKFPTVLISDEKMKRYHVQTKDVDKTFRNKDVQKILDEEFEMLVVDRDQYRAIMLKIESHNPGQVVVDNKHQMPVNIYRIIEDTAYNFQDNVQGTLDPVRTVKKVRAICKTIAYAYFNEIQERAEMKIPEHIVHATTFLRILLRSHLCVRHLLDRGITDDLLDVVLDKVKVTFSKSLAQYGTAIGIISAQSIGEPMTQMSLDTKHRAGAGGKSKTNPIVRIMEIIGVRPTKTMKNPSMTIMVREEFEDDKLKVQEIANHVEMMRFERFIWGTSVFFESFGNPIHPRFKGEAKMINAFQKHNAGIDLPADLAKWCIRFALNKEEMVINNMSIEKIIRALRVKYPDAYFVYTPENARDLIIRCYVRGVMLKSSSETAIMAVMADVRTTVISGINGIKSTSVIDYIKSYVADDGSVQNKKVWVIATVGTNLEAVMENEYLDKYRSQTDSVVEFEEIFGIEAARGKIIAEMLKTINANRAHCSMYADEMSYTGHLSSIQKSGMNKRDMDPCLRLAFQSPNQVIEDAAVHGLVSKITGVSAPLIVGAAPMVGTAFNKIVVNTKFLQEHAASMAKVEDEL